VTCYHNHLQSHSAAIEKLLPLTKYTHVHHVPHAEHVESSIGRKMAKVECCQDEAILSSAYPVYRSASKANRSGADAQVVSCHRYLVVFHPFIEQLTVFHTSGLILVSSSILDLNLYRDSIMSGTCQRGT